jgi:segregation and condensation protein B
LLAAGIPWAWRRRTQPARRLSEFFGPQIAAWSLPTEKLTRDDVLARVEAALLASHEPVSIRRLMKLADLPDQASARGEIERLADLLRRDGSPFTLEEIAGGYQFLTRPTFRPALEKLCQIRSDITLSGPMLETLAIVAYRQPICRADVEAIRGVQVGEILRHLLDAGLLRLAGKDKSLGRPFLYATTARFLEMFGLRNLHELPMVETLGRSATTAMTKDPSARPIDQYEGDEDDEENDDGWEEEEPGEEE